MRFRSPDAPTEMMRVERVVATARVLLTLLTVWRLSWAAEPGEASFWTFVLALVDPHTRFSFCCCSCRAPRSAMLFASPLIR